MKKLLSILLITVVSFSAFSQKSTLDKANKLFKLKAYLEAATLYKASGLETKNVLQNLGDCYYFNNQMNDANNTYEKLFKKYNANEIDPPKLYFIFLTLNSNFKLSLSAANILLILSDEPAFFFSNSSYRA